MKNEVGKKMMNLPCSPKELVPSQETVTISRGLWIQLQQDAATILGENANLRAQFEREKKAWAEERWHLQQRLLQREPERQPRKTEITARVHQYEATGGKKTTKVRKMPSHETPNDVLRWESKNQLCISYETHCAVVEECKRLLQVLKDKYRQGTDKLVRQLEEAQQQATQVEAAFRSTCFERETQLQCIRKLHQKELRRNQTLHKRVMVAKETSFTLKRYLGELLHFAQEMTTERSVSRAISQKCFQDVRRLTAQCDQEINLADQLGQKLKDVTRATAAEKARQREKKVRQLGRFTRHKKQLGRQLSHYRTLSSKQQSALEMLSHENNDLRRQLQALLPSKIVTSTRSKSKRKGCP